MLAAWHRSTRRSAVRHGAELGAAPTERQWWRDAVVYQVYVRSFADAQRRRDRRPGRRPRAPAVPARPRRRRALVQPVVPVAAGGQPATTSSTTASIDPAFGTLEEAEQLIAEARALGIRTIVDIVPNHVSSQHPWFRAALAVAAGIARARALLVPARARARTASCRRTAGSRSSAGRPGRARDDGDRRVVPPPVRARAARPQLDAPRRLGRARGRPPLLVRPRRRRRADRLGGAARQGPGARRGAAGRRRPASTRSPTATSCTRSTAAGARSPTATPSRASSSARSGCPTPSGFARYLRPDELHTAFNFDFLALPVGARAGCARRSSRRSRRTRRSTRRRPGCSRTTTSPGRSRATAAPTRRSRSSRSAQGTPTDLERGTRRARAAALLAMALPGSMYVYQGEELGLPEVEDIPSERRQDPMWLRSGGVDPGRDGCRVPLPWSGDRPPYGFSPDGSARPWLDQPDDWAPLTVAAQTGDPASMLALYRAGLRLRRAGAWGWRRRSCAGSPPATTSLAFARGERLRLPRQLRPGSGGAAGGRRRPHRQRRARRRCLPQDTTVWLRQRRASARPDAHRTATWTSTGLATGA